MRLYVDRSRILYSTDKSGREAHISCGAVLDHLRVAMAAAGWISNVERFPDPNNLDHLASLDFSPMSLVTDGQRRRADAILHRRTDRLPFAAPRNWESFEPVLRDTVDAGTVHLDVIAEELRPELARASRLTESLRLYDSSYHVELDWWTGHFENSDGIPRSSLVSGAESDRVASDVHSRLALTTSGTPALGKTSPRCWFCPPTRTPAMTRCGAAKRCPPCYWSARWPGWRHAH